MERYVRREVGHSIGEQSIIDLKELCRETVFDLFFFQSSYIQFGSMLAFSIKDDHENISES